jgi:hypothetical protein
MTGVPVAISLAGASPSIYFLSAFNSCFSVGIGIPTFYDRADANHRAAVLCAPNIVSKETDFLFQYKNMYGNRQGVFLTRKKKWCTFTPPSCSA